MTLALAVPAAMLVWVLPVLLLLSSPARVCGDRCVTSLSEIGHPVVKYQLDEPTDYFFASNLCPVSFDPLFAIDSMTAEEKALCGSDSLAPLILPEGSEWRKDKFRRMMKLKDVKAADEPGTSFSLRKGKKVGEAALNLTSGRWHLVSKSRVIECLLCQRKNEVLELAGKGLAGDTTKDPGVDELTFLDCHYFQVNVTAMDATTTAKVNAEELLEIRTALTQLLQPVTCYQTKMKTVPLVYRKSFEDGRVQFEFRLHAVIPKSVVESSNSTKLIGKYLVFVEDASFCPSEETVDAAGVVTVWCKHFVEGSYQMVKNPISKQILRRDCTFDDSSYRAKWSDVSFWQLEWGECSDDETFTSEEIYKDFLDEETVYRHNHQLERYASAPLNSTELKTVSKIVNRQVDLTNNIGDVTALDLVNITANLLLGDGEDVCLAQDTRVYVLVAALEGKTPVLGLTVEYKDHTNAGNLNITLDRTQSEKPRPHEQFALAISGGLVKAHKRMMLFVYWMETPSVDSRSRYERRTKQYIEMTVALVLKTGQKGGALSYGRDWDYYVDVTFKPSRDGKGVFYTVTKCSAWNNLVGRWATEGCHPLKAKRGKLTVCRCSAKYFALTEIPGVATARFALNKAYELKPNVTFVGFFSGNTVLIVFTFAECLLSALGLCSIVATAIAFKAWRQNTGHQILMHMLLALTCNLVLGFVTSFVHLNTESVGCVALGVLRHYTFLAMFLWMLVLSGLQRKRLTTVAGAKAVTHLILKASVFAWGIPLLPIAVLLVWDTRFYNQDSLDRGYCYPEGLAFTLTVQTPAGLILFVNFLIFVAIVTHIFECRGGTKITKHSNNKTTEQLNKLKTSLFMFFLFGFTWVFHFMSEEHIIDSLFLFEYLFLMTATTHVLVLALFFVVLQESTRKDWLGLLGKLRCGSKPVPVAPVQAARPAYQPQLPKGIANRLKQERAEKAAAKKNTAA